MLLCGTIFRSPGSGSKFEPDLDPKIGVKFWFAGFDLPRLMTSWKGRILTPALKPSMRRVWIWSSMTTRHFTRGVLNNKYTEQRIIRQCFESGSGWIRNFFWIRIRNYLFRIRIQVKVKRKNRSIVKILLLLCSN